MEHEELIRLFSGKVRRIMERATLDMANIYEIRLRVHSPLLLVYAGEEFFVTEEGAVLPELTGWKSRDIRFRRRMSEKPWNT